MGEKELALVIKLYEVKLKSYMKDEEYFEFVTYVAKQAFKLTLNEMEDSEFKKFCLENIDSITM